MTFRTDSLRLATMAVCAREGVDIAGLPAPELLELTDKMGFLVIDEIFDVWERRKTPHDFHLIFPDWYEPDTRSFIHRDRNHP